MVVAAIEQANGNSYKMTAFNGCFLNSGSIRVSVHVDTNGNIKAYDTSGTNTASSAVDATGVRATVCLDSSSILLPGQDRLRVVQFSSNSVFSVVSAYSNLLAVSFASAASIKETSTTIV